MNSDFWQDVGILCLSITCIGNSIAIIQLRGTDHVLWIKNTWKRIFKWACFGGLFGKHAKENAFSSSAGDASNGNSSESLAKRGSARSGGSRDTNV